MFGTDKPRLMIGVTLTCVVALSVSGIAFTSPTPFIQVDPVLLAGFQSSAYFAVSFFVLIGIYLARIIHQPNPISSGREGLAVLTGMA